MGLANDKHISGYLKTMPSKCRAGLVIAYLKVPEFAGQLLHQLGNRSDLVALLTVKPNLSL